MVESAAFEVVPQVTISVGVAQRAQGELAEQTIARADARLYAAKSAGRNRVEI
jgi:diguanylate cyclase